MGFWNWLFGKSGNQYETPKKKRGQVPGVAYGSKPEKPGAPMEFEVKKPEPVVEFDTRHFEFAEFSRNRVLVRQKRTLSIEEARERGLTDSKLSNFALRSYGPFYEPDESAPWVEYRSERGIRWFNKDGDRLLFELERMLDNKLSARKLF